MILFTRFLQTLMLSLVGEDGQTKLTDQQEYVARCIKFGLVMFTFVLSVYARIYREEVTENFTIDADDSCPKSGVEEKLLPPLRG